MNDISVSMLGSERENISTTLISTVAYLEGNGNPPLMCEKSRSGLLRGKPERKQQGMTSSYLPDPPKSFSLAQPQQHHLNFQLPTTINSKENTPVAIELLPLSQRCQACPDKSPNTMGPISPPTIPW